MRLFLSLACLILLSPFARAADALVFCFENENVRPWRTVEVTGLNFDLLNRVATQTGLSFRYEGTPWKRCLQDLRSGTVDGALAASFRPERRKIAAYPGGDKPDVSKHLHVDRYVVVRRKGSAVNWDGKDFHGLSGPVGAQFGYSVVSDLKEAGTLVDDGAHSPVDVLRKLLHGRVDAVTCLAGEAAALLEEAEFRSLEILPRPYIEKPYYLIMSHAMMASRRATAEAIWNGIQKVRNSAEYKAKERAALAAERKPGK